ncbi:WD40-repeat-containing domain protein [Stachybotrys elegans]|uniref:WD40-repeat-containing domain protein n=1 Tax=Stachybotrys elegans TaxID=80388 RepID=A0A8K0WX12_9HYPO|nr:WD40-repeat-containing domain protein [Stachybotrys elegans]
MMRSSPLFKSSSHCIASPNGQHIATFTSSTTITIRSVETLQTVNAVKLPADVTGPVSTLLWSPSSTKLLAATAEQIVVLSANNVPFQAVIRNPLAGGNRPSAIQFGAADTEIIVFAAFGLKVAVFDLSTSKAVEISSPKFYQPVNCARGYCFHKSTGHMAVLTRLAGKDTISVHHPSTRHVQRSWAPDVVDAQGMLWTPDGAWLLLWESPAHGRRMLLYTPDGQLFRSIESPSLSARGDADLEPGIRLCQLTPDAAVCAVCDYSRTIVLLSSDTWREKMRLVHPATIVPKETIQVWQEQLDPSRGRLAYPFLRATQMVSPPGLQAEPKSAAELKSGPSAVAFDASSTLLATRLDDCTSTIWVWDTAAAELRAVLIFHSGVSFQWHPTVRELLLIRCLDDGRRDVAFIWDPLSNGPVPVSLGEQRVDAKPCGKLQTAWINGTGTAESAALLLLSDATRYALLSVSISDDQTCTSWQQEEGGGSASAGGSADLRLARLDDITDMPAIDQDDESALDDTFAFKRK